MGNRLLLILITLSVYVHGQDGCRVINSNNSLLSNNLINSGCLSALPSEYKIRINFHFLLKDDGTGSYTETLNPLGTQTGYNGYTFSDFLVWAANIRLGNQVMNFQPNPPVPAQTINNRWYVNGVFFWRNTDDYLNHNGDHQYLRNKYGKNIGEAINVFFVMPNSNTPYNGAVDIVGGDVAIISLNLISIYQSYVNNNDFWGANAIMIDIFSHELFHCLNLHHTVRYDFGPCCNSSTCDDGCADTPSWSMLTAQGKAPCNWCDANGNYSNNIMDYSCNMGALTPCQISTVNSHVLNNKTCFISCAYNTIDLDICNSPIESYSYLARNINVIPTSCNANTFIVPVKTKTYLNAENIIINKSFEVQLGAEFETIIRQSCK